MNMNKPKFYSFNMTMMVNRFRMKGIEFSCFERKWWSELWNVDLQQITIFISPSVQAKRLAYSSSSLFTFELLIFLMFDPFSLLFECSYYHQFRLLNRTFLSKSHLTFPVTFQDSSTIAHDARILYNLQANTPIQISQRVVKDILWSMFNLSKFEMQNSIYNSRLDTL